MSQWGQPYVTERRIEVGGVRQVIKETKVDLYSSRPWCPPGRDDKVEFTQVIGIEVRAEDASDYT